MSYQEAVFVRCVARDPPQENLTRFGTDWSPNTVARIHGAAGKKRAGG